MEVVIEEHRQQVDAVPYALQGVWCGERSDPITPSHSPQAEVHMQMYIEGMCASKTENHFSYATMATAVASAQEVRLTR